MGLTSLFTLTAATDLSVQSEPEVRVDAGIYSEAPASASDVAKKLQNPIGDFSSFPFQSNTNFRVGPNTGA
jgi:hypothetical protein